MNTQAEVTVTHSPEPWEGCDNCNCQCGHIWSVPQDFPVATAHIHMQDSPDMIYASIKPDQMKANAARIVACVNACEGIDSPADVLARVRELAEAINRDAWSDDQTRLRTIARTSDKLLALLPKA